MNERTWHKNCNLPPLLLKGVKSRRNFKCQNCKHANPPTHTRASGDFSRCDPAGIQTQDLQNRNLTLYSAKLRSHFFSWCKDSARRAENKGKLVFLLLPRCSLSCERTRSVWGWLADFQGWGLNIHNWFSAASRVRGK